MRSPFLMWLIPLIMGPVTHADFSDDFSDGIIDDLIWAVVDPFAGDPSSTNYGTFTEMNGRLMFLAPEVPPDEAAVLHLIIRELTSLDEGFHLKFSMANHYVAGSSIHDVFPGLFVRCFRTADEAVRGWVLLNLDTNGRLGFRMETSSPTGDIRDTVFAGGTIAESVGPEVSLKIAFDQESRLLSIFSIGQDAETLLGTIGLGPVAGTIETVDWRFPEEVRFEFALTALSEPRGSNVQAVEAGEIWFDEVMLEFLQTHWGPWEIQHGFVDTENWLGWLWIDQQPWIWSERLSRWIYIPEETAAQAQGWIFLP